MNPLCGIIICVSLNYDLCIIRSNNKLYVCRNSIYAVGQIVWFTFIDNIVVDYLGKYQSQIFKIISRINLTDLYILSSNFHNIINMCPINIRHDYIDNLLITSPRDVFILGEECKLQESSSVEFKSFKNTILPTIDTCDIIEKYSIGFLNSQREGIILFGIEDNSIVSGTIKQLDKEPSQKDRIQRQIASVLNRCKPYIEPKLYSVEFYDVWNPQTQEYEKDKWVVGIKIQSVNNNIIYSTTDNKVYIRELSRTIQLTNQQVNSLQYSRTFGYTTESPSVTKSRLERKK
jgi:hypothetical protein